MNSNETDVWMDVVFVNPGKKNNVLSLLQLAEATADMLVATPSVVPDIILNYTSLQT